jgi:hypothetical protein
MLQEPTSGTDTATMKSTTVDSEGNVVCPKCKAKNAYVVKRTGMAKILVGATVGVGALAAPKRLRCMGCGTYLKMKG